MTLSLFKALNDDSQAVLDAVKVSIYNLAADELDAVVATGVGYYVIAYKAVRSSLRG